MNRADVQMLQGSLERMGHTFRDNKRWAEHQILEEEMRKRDEQRYQDQQRLQAAMQEWDKTKHAESMHLAHRAAHRADTAQNHQIGSANKQWEAGAKGRLSKEEKDAIELELLRHQRDQLRNPKAGGTTGGAAAAPLFNIEGQIDPDTGARTIQSFSGKVDESYLNHYLDSLKAANAPPELQPNTGAAQGPGFWARLFGAKMGKNLPPNAAAAQYRSALDQAVAAGEITEQEAESAFGATRAKQNLW